MQNYSVVWFVVLRLVTTSAHGFIASVRFILYVLFLFSIVSLHCVFSLIICII